MRFSSKLFVVMGLIGVSFSSTRAQAQISQAPTRTYSSVWEPVSAAQIQNLVGNNASNGLALDQIWWRANLYGRTGEFMTALRDVIRKQPDNSVALAFYAGAALEWRAVFINGPTHKVPAQIERDFGLSLTSIRAISNKAIELNPRNWIALLFEPEIRRNTGGGRYPSSVDQVSYSKRALRISDNPWTNVLFANALMDDSTWHLTKNPKGLTRRAIEILKRSRRRFPNYPRTDVALFQIYAYWPLGKNPVEARKAEQRLIASIRPALRKTAPVERYLKSIHLDQIGK